METQKVYGVVEEISCYSCERSYLTPTKEVLLALKENIPLYCRNCKDRVDVYVMYVPVKETLRKGMIRDKINHYDYIAEQLAEKTEKDVKYREIDDYPKYVKVNL